MEYMSVSRKTFRLIHAWLPAVIWMVVIFVFSSQHKVSVSEEYVLNFLFFKTLHLIEYAVLYIFFYRALKVSGLTGLNGWSFILLILYAASDEFHQTQVYGREGTVRDVIIDSLGALIAWILIRYTIPKAPEKLKSLARKLDIA